jgi:hypothetical protein
LDANKKAEVSGLKETKHQRFTLALDWTPATPCKRRAVTRETRKRVPLDPQCFSREISIDTLAQK